jgi:hypothetical protein
MQVLDWSPQSRVRNWHYSIRSGKEWFMDNGLIDKHNSGHMETGVRNYIRIYEFPFYGNLHENLNRKSPPEPIQPFQDLPAKLKEL